MPRMIVTVNKLNRRSGPIANVADKSNVIDIVRKGFVFNSINETHNAAGIWYEDDAKKFYWGGGITVDSTLVEANTTTTTSVSSANILLKTPATLPAAMPLSIANCLKCAAWLKDNFGDKINAAVKNTPFDAALIYAITCQETAQRWLLWIKDYDAKTILERSVFDASGDIANTSRSAFPKNKTALVEKYGTQLTNMLIDEANKMRSMPQPGYPKGFQQAGYLYKGYGIFQYDLQHIVNDKDFFENKLWYSIDACVDRLIKELNTKWKNHPNDMYATVKAYNGSGLKAEQYVQKVSQFYSWIKAM